MAQVGGHWPLSVEDWVCTHVSPSLICGGQTGTGTGFSPSSSIFSCQYHTTIALYSSIIAPKVCNSPNQAAHHHSLGPKLGASSLTPQVAGK
jgi:hypothetical protein